MRGSYLRSRYLYP